MAHKAANEDSKIFTKSNVASGRGESTNLVVIGTTHPGLEHNKSNSWQWSSRPAHLAQYGRGHYSLMAPFSPIANPHISPLTCISSHWLFAFVILFANKVDTLCDRLAILVSGRINAEGSPDRLKQQFGGGYKVGLRLNKMGKMNSLHLKVSLKLAADNSEENVAELLAGIPGVHLVGQRSNWMNYRCALLWKTSRP